MYSFFHFLHRRYGVLALFRTRNDPFSFQDRVGGCTLQVPPCFGFVLCCLCFHFAVVQSEKTSCGPSFFFVWVFVLKDEPPPLFVWAFDFEGFRHRGSINALLRRF